MNTFLIVVGVLVALVVGAFVLLLLYVHYNDRAVAEQEARVRGSGQPVMSVLVMANSELLSGEREGGPALIAIDLSPEPKKHVEALRAFSSRTYELYALPDSAMRSLSRSELRVAVHAKDHAYQAGRRFRVPDELTGGRDYYLLDAWLYADRTRPYTEEDRLIPCLITGSGQGEVMQLPHTEMEARTLFRRYEEAKAQPGQAGEGAQRSEGPPKPIVAATPQGPPPSGDPTPSRRAPSERSAPRGRGAGTPAGGKASSGRSRYAVVLGSYEQLDPAVFAPVLEAALGIRSYDAVKASRDSRGVLAERGVPELAADRLVEGLAGHEIEAFKVPVERVLRVGKPTQVRLIEPKEDALHVVMGYSSTAQVRAYEDLVLASGGWITEVRARPTRHRRTKKRRGMGFMTVVGGAMFGIVGAKIGRDADKAVEEAEKIRSRVKPTSASTDVGLADLFLREQDGSFLHIRLRNRDLYYPQILGEEAVKDFQVNFSQVLCRILNQTPGVSYNPGLEFMINDSADVDPAEAQFGSEKEFTAFTRWLLQITEIADLLPESDSEDDLEGTPFALIEEDEAGTAVDAPASTAEDEDPAAGAGQPIGGPIASEEEGGSGRPSGRLLGGPK